MNNLVVCHDLNTSSIRAQKTWFSEKKNRKKAGRCEVVDFPIPYAKSQKNRVNHKLSGPVLGNETVMECANESHLACYRSIWHKTFHADEKIVEIRDCEQNWRICRKQNYCILQESSE